MPSLAAGLDPFGLTLDHTVDIGMFLTFVTLVAGLVGWTFKTVKEWRRDSRREAESGALRLLLKILRERHAGGGGPIAPAELRSEFERPERRAERKAYCGRDFRFADDDDFERAVYQLHWEFKLDFTEGDKLLFRTVADPYGRRQFSTALDPVLVVASFSEALKDSTVQPYDLERLARLAATADLKTTQRLLVDATEAARGDTGTVRRLLILADLLSHEY
ncbi:hypothetical protein [Jatrophihabitans sp.]|uniref:hypothetical protein n=1 Tax=Jatrophihabitans sp. TaxID=1932789 RepID=UPI002D149954|nr:hypothetical protein [Jatrophihabitans sp.]